MCMAKDRDLEDLWSPMVGASADKVLVFVRMLGAPSRGGSSEPIDCTVAEWSYPDPAVDLTRRAAPAMGSGGAQDLPDRGPAIVYCSLYAAVRYVNEVVQADSEVRINMAAGVYHVGSKTLPPITRRTPLFIYGASKRGRTRELPSLECAGEAKDGRKPLPFQRDIEGEVLLTVRKFASSVSISPGGAVDGYYSDDSSEEPDPSVPIDHMTAPLQPIPEPPPLHHHPRH